MCMQRNYLNWIGVIYLFFTISFFIIFFVLLIVVYYKAWTCLCMCNFIMKVIPFFLLIDKNSITGMYRLVRTFFLNNMRLLANLKLLSLTKVNHMTILHLILTRMLITPCQQNLLGYWCSWYDFWMDQYVLSYHAKYWLVPTRTY